MGNADVRVAFSAKSHDLNVSTHALMILLHFEKLGDDDFLTYSVSPQRTRTPLFMLNVVRRKSKKRR